MGVAEGCTKRKQKPPSALRGSCFIHYLLQLQLEPSVLAEQLQPEPQLQELFSAIWFSFICMVLFALSVLRDFKDLEHFIDGLLPHFCIFRSHHV